MSRYHIFSTRSRVRKLFENIDPSIEVSLYHDKMLSHWKSIISDYIDWHYILTPLKVMPISLLPVSKLLPLPVPTLTFISLGLILDH